MLGFRGYKIWSIHTLMFYLIMEINIIWIISYSLSLMGQKYFIHSYAPTASWIRQNDALKVHKLNVGQILDHLSHIIYSLGILVYMDQYYSTLKGHLTNTKVTKKYSQTYIGGKAFAENSTAFFMLSTKSYWVQGRQYRHYATLSSLLKNMV